jgi:uncharacterized protein (TIGR03435 family)
MSSRVRVSLLTMIMVAAQASGQTTVPAFEVASVKPSPPVGPSWTLRADGRPGTADPTRIQYRNMSRANLLSRAYGVKFNQLSGRLGLWTNSTMTQYALLVPTGRNSG